MVNLLDIMRQAQQGSAYDNMARQFGMSSADVQRAAEALMPAFSLGLQRSGSDPSLFGNVLGMMTSGRYAPFYDKPFAGFWPQAQASGNDVLGQLFGSPEMVRRIAGQASAMSGIASPIIQQMMPAMAAMLMGGLFRWTSVEGFVDFLRRWADWLQASKLPHSPPPRRPDGNANPFAPWIDMTTALFGQASQSRPSPARKAPAASPPPLADPWSEMMRAWTGAKPAEPPPPPPPPPPAQPNPFETLAAMLATGRDVQAQHFASMQSLFDSMWGTGRTR